MHRTVKRLVVGGLALAAIAGVGGQAAYTKAQDFHRGGGSQAFNFTKGQATAFHFTMRAPNS